MSDPKFTPRGGCLFVIGVTLLAWALIGLGWLAYHDHTHRPGTLDPILNHQDTRPMNP